MSNLIKILEKNNCELTKEDIEKNKEFIGLKHDKDKYTALMCYLLFNSNPSIEIIKLLEKEKDIFDNNNYTPLMHYLNNPNIKNIDTKIIEYFSNQIGLIGAYNQTALLRYLFFNKNPSIDIIKLLEKEKNIFDNNTPLMHYCMNINLKNLNPEIIEYFSNQIGLRGACDYTALMCYLMCNTNRNIEDIKLLEKEIGIVSILDSKYGYTLKMTALKHYIHDNNNIDENIVKFLQKEINIIDDDKLTALDWYLYTVSNIKIDIIKLLINDNFTTSTIGGYKLHNGKNTDTNILNMLYYYYITINYKTLNNYLKENDNPSLDIIISYMNYIIINHITPDIMNYNINNLFYYCMNNKIFKLDPFIIKYFSNQIGLKNSLGCTALMYYLSYSGTCTNIDSIKLLEKEINIKDNNGNSPLDYYLKNHIYPITEIINLLMY